MTAAVLSVGAYRPEYVVSNEEICRHIDSSDEWIRTRSGIATRHRARPDETIVDMAEAASRIAIERAGIQASQVDAVVVATITFPWQTPSAAALLAHRVGAGPAAAFDLSAACAGFTYGVALASDMVRGGSAGHVLVVGVEKFSDFVDPTDRGTAFIFGDGAGAVVIGPPRANETGRVVGAGEGSGIGPVVWGSDGAKWDVIRSKHSWLDLRDAARAAALREAAVAEVDVPDLDEPRGLDEAEGADAAPDPLWPNITMAGQSVFRWAVWQMAPIARKTLEAAGVEPRELTAFVPHQANARIIDAMAKQLALPEHVHISHDVARSGNTSAASIPLAMDRMLAEGDAASGDLALLLGFGAGLTYASQVVRLP